MKVLLVAVALMAGCASAWAGHRHGHFGVYIGPYWGPWWYPPVYSYSSPVIVERRTPVYVDPQPVVVEVAPGDSYWYFCRAANTYYPYVKECPAGWEKVLSKPAGE